MHRDCRSCETPNIFSTHRQCTGCRMQRADANGVVSSISLLRLPHLSLDVGRIPCRSTAPGVKCVRAIHPSAMAAASEHSDGPKNKLASSSSPYLKQHETNPVSICDPELTGVENLVAIDACPGRLSVVSSTFETRCRSIGTPGAKRLSRRLALKTSPSSCQSATAPVTGKSWCSSSLKGTL